MKKLIVLLLFALPIVAKSQAVIEQGNVTSNTRWRGYYQFVEQLKLPVVSGQPLSPLTTYRLGNSGLIKYDSTNRVLYLNDGSGWFPVNIMNPPEHADNAAAKQAGLGNNIVFRTGDALKITHP